VQILKAARCEPDTPAVERAENHHELVRKAVKNIMEAASKQGGTLGASRGIKYQVYTRLERYYEETKETLFVSPTLKQTIDDIFKYRMLESAKDILSRELKVKASDEQLAQTAEGLRDEGKLVVYDQADTGNMEPQIICSMGLRGEVQK
jgi:hypothetical protein